MTKFIEIHSVDRRRSPKTLGVPSENQRVAGFSDPSRDGEPTAGSLLTFTGVQVLDPLVLDYIPAGRPSSIWGLMRACSMS